MDCDGDGVVTGVAELRGDALRRVLGDGDGVVESVKDELSGADADAADVSDAAADDDPPRNGDTDEETHDDRSGVAEFSSNEGEMVGDALADVDSEGAGLLDEERLEFAEFDGGTLPEDERLATALALKDTEEVDEPLREVLAESVCVCDELAVTEGVGDTDGLVDVRKLPDKVADAVRDKELVWQTVSDGDVEELVVARTEDVAIVDGDELVETEAGDDGDAAPLGERADDAVVILDRDTDVVRLMNVDAVSVADNVVDTVAATDGDELAVEEEFTLADIGTDGVRSEEGDEAPLVVV